ncbi:MAG: ACT domain-containing protein [Candidatus Aenigmatarchaeota archaeon]
MILPFHIRDYFGLRGGMELLITNNEKNELRIFPLFNEKTAKIRITMTDVPGAMSKILSVLGKNKIDVMMSTSQTIEKGKLAEWNGIVDISKCRNKNMKKLENELKNVDVIRKVDILTTTGKK